MVIGTFVVWRIWSKWALFSSSQKEKASGEKAAARSYKFSREYECRQCFLAAKQTVNGKRNQTFGKKLICLASNRRTNIHQKYHSPYKSIILRRVGVSRNPCACVKESEEAVSGKVRLCQSERSFSALPKLRRTTPLSTQQRNSSLLADIFLLFEGSEFCRQMLPFPRCIECHPRSSHDIGCTEENQIQVFFLPEMCFIIRAMDGAASESGDGDIGSGRRTDGQQPDGRSADGRTDGRTGWKGGLAPHAPPSCRRSTRLELALGRQLRWSSSSCPQNGVMWNAIQQILSRDTFYIIILMHYVLSVELSMLYPSS